MEKEEKKEATLLNRPNIDMMKLNYIKGSRDIYVNLYKIILKKNLDIYQYPYAITPEIANEDMAIRDKLFKYSLKKLRPIYGEHFQSGDSLYGTNLVKEVKSITAFTYSREGKIEYTITFQPCANTVSLKN